MQHDEEVKDEIVTSLQSTDDKVLIEESPGPLKGTASTKKVETKKIKRSIPPPGTGEKIYEIDPTLNGYRQHLEYR